MRSIFLLTLLFALNSILKAQQASYPSSFEEPIQLFDVALGDFEYTISSDNEKAQAYFNQGFQMMYAFTKVDAARSFREAQKADPDCAVCYWGEAWAWGSYLNGAMTNSEAPRAYEKIQEAVRLSQNNGSEKEKDLIRAFSVRYIEDYDRSKRAVQDTLYSKEMEKLAMKYPNDLDIATLYAESLFLLEPRRGTRDVNDPDVEKLHSVLEEILEKDIKHPGACHLYIHATESTQNPEWAEPCAEFIGTSIPGASHINHMPSHTWNEIGRWGDAVTANIMAWHSDMKASVGEGFAIYPSHNLHMLAFAASMDGQGAIAIQAGKDYAKLTGNNMYHVLTLIRFGRFDEVSGIESRPSHSIHGGMWDFAQGYAALKSGDSNKAIEMKDKVLKEASTSSARFRFHSAENLLHTVGYILEGEIFWVNGDLDKAESSFKKAIEYYDSLAYDEPEPIPFSPRHWYGALLLDMKKYDQAIDVYGKELESHPNNGWSLFGIQQALKAQGKSDSKIDDQFSKSWKRSDTWIRGSRF
jgi:tetratricopeptide (TPR) repeat protein